jgi:hypothetical protein
MEHYFALWFPYTWLRLTEANLKYIEDVMVAANGR